MLTTRNGIQEPSVECRLALIALAEDLRGDLEQVAGEVAGAIHRGVEVLSEDMFPDTLVSTQANIALVMTLLPEGADPVGVELPVDATHYVREFVHRGFPLETLLAVYRVGHGAFWQLWLERMREGIEDREVLAEAIAFCSAWTFGYIDAVAKPLASGFLVEKERWARSAVAQRAEEVALVLEGRPVDEQRTSARLRYELGRRHVAYVLWAEEVGAFGDADSVLSRAAAAIGRALG
ncbi:MAG: hypothetical protein JWM31_1740, partial [Solirubrobacterales bacterium]|nr:hypothetical protein [Solirubrobacterales bacterium]